MTDEDKIEAMLDSGLAINRKDAIEQLVDMGELDVTDYEPEELAA